MTPEEFIKQAKTYLALGFSIIPVGRDKKPLIKWEEFQHRKASEDEIKIWANSFKGLNIGIVTGAISKIVVVDIEAGGSIEGFPPSLIVRTGGGGWHFYLKYPEQGIGNPVRIREKTDIRGDGGYVVAPPSLHMSGKQYEWAVAPLDADLADLPDWLLRLVNNEGKSKIDWRAFIDKEYPEGIRNSSLTKFIGKLLNDLTPEMWEIAAWPAVLDWNTNHNKPPLDEKELRRTFYSIANRQINKSISSESQLDPKIIEDARNKNLAAINADTVISTLGLTIKKDEINKLITFMAMLSTYTKDSQLNLSFNAPSSSGKTYLPLEIAKIFPPEDVVEVGYCSPTAFFHDHGEFDKKKNEYVINFTGKVLIFLDQPHDQLLQRLRPVLSHDKKEVIAKITDKTQKHGTKTKNIRIIGFPAVIFCTAGLNLDEQEATRFLLLSPEINQEKIREAISEKILKETDPASYYSNLSNDPYRKALQERIQAIKEANIETIRLETPDLIKKEFMSRAKILKPKHQRDIGRIIGLTKIIALLNFWDRQLDGSSIVATEEDVKEAFKIWDSISDSQELNLPPYVYNLYLDVILPAYMEKNNASQSGVKQGVTKQDILTKHYKVYGRFLSDNQLRQQILPLLETAGLITIEKDDPQDKRKILIYPTSLLTISGPQNNSEPEGGVSDEELDEVLRIWGETDEN